MINEKKIYSHLTYRDRTIISHELTNKASFTTIAKTLGKNKSISSVKETILLMNQKISKLGKN